MRNIDDDIKDSDDNICNNIELLIKGISKEFVSSNILNNLRNLVEAIIKKIYSLEHPFNNTKDDLHKALTFASQSSISKPLFSFHNLLQISVSHITWGEDESARLMLKYYDRIYEAKEIAKKAFGMEILHNLGLLPINVDQDSFGYYDNISKLIEKISSNKSGLNKKYYYAQKCKPFRINNKTYYEITLIQANENVSKYDRILMFSKKRIFTNYSIQLSIKEAEIFIENKKIPIKIIVDFVISIRNKEYEMLSKILGYKYDELNSGVKLLIEKHLTNEELSFVHLLDISDYEYSDFKKKILWEAKCDLSHILNMIEFCRNLLKNCSPGINVIRYLLSNMRIKVLNLQYENYPNKKLSNLHLWNKCIPFDEMPFVSSLKGHNPPLDDVIMCISTIGREHELLARRIKDNAEKKQILYTKIKDISKYGNILDLAKKYNDKLWEHHKSNRELVAESDYIYIKGYQDDVVSIISKLRELPDRQHSEYKTKMRSWIFQERLKNPEIKENKEKLLTNLFNDTKVAIIYGSAGTGKSTLIRTLSVIFNKKKRIYLANTYPAMINMQKKVFDESDEKWDIAEFYVLSKFIKKNYDRECGVLFLDECNNISNHDISKILRLVSFDLVVMAGDVFQLKSINFGNWFNLIKHFISEQSIHELTDTFRTDDSDLLELWKSVRQFNDAEDEIITERTIVARYSKPINQISLKSNSEDEIVLCFNYDGIYGINNINSMLQAENHNESFLWNDRIYKIGDPVLFNESNRFKEVLYNNLKGKILNIIRNKESIEFCIEINGMLPDSNKYQDLKVMIIQGENRTILNFTVDEYTDTDDENIYMIVPFQISYATSIHKSQGLEYSSVKLVIGEYIKNAISLDIFYTAITRAKRKLEIYWSPETQNEIISSFKKNPNNKDALILKSKLNNLRNY